MAARVGSAYRSDPGSVPPRVKYPGQHVVTVAAGQGRGQLAVISGRRVPQWAKRPWCGQVVARAVQDPGASAGASLERTNQAGLADPGLAEDEGHTAFACRGLGKGSVEHIEFAVSLQQLPGHPQILPG